ncbi:hypothetical protein L9H28_10110 [Corynebacterium propinquum]|nr:hypothetical protein L9H28_10110 [Corynebacterium propinquum]
MSLDKWGEGLGVERQEAECRELAERNGWMVTKVFPGRQSHALYRPGETNPHARLTEA